MRKRCLRCLQQSKPVVDLRAGASEEEDKRWNNIRDKGVNGDGFVKRRSLPHYQSGHKKMMPFKEQVMPFKIGV